MSRRALFAFALALGACGGKPASAPAASLEVPKMGATEPRRAASEALARRWPFDDGVRAALYADVGAMMRHEPLRALAGAAPTGCVGETLSAARELAVGADDRGVLVLARFDAVPEEALRACAKDFGSPRRELVIEGDIALFGDPALVSAARAGGGPRSSPRTLELSAGRVAAFQAKASGIEARGGVVASDERFRVDVTAVVPEEVGRVLEERFARGAPLGPLSRAFTLERSGGRVSAVFELREAPREQARDLGILAALAAHGVQAYLTRAKAAEARSTVAALARAYAGAWETGRRKLVPYPPVPRVVPRGEAVSAADAGWGAYAPLGFELSGTQYFQYEITVARDGRSAEIVARGDLDGDGATSSFRVRMKIDAERDALVPEGPIEETDPDE